MKALLLVLLLVPASAFAQTSQVRRGVPLYFDHDEQSILITTRYQLCQDVMDDANCKDIENVVRLQGTLTFQFPLPTWVLNGAHLYAVRAFGEGEYSDVSNVLTLVVTGKPLPPTNNRTQGPTTTASGQPTTTPPSPQPATLSLTPPKSVVLPTTPSMKNPRNQD